jgi:hypothetical protein
MHLPRESLFLTESGYSRTRKGGKGKYSEGHVVMSSKMVKDAREWGKQRLLFYIHIHIYRTIVRTFNLPFFELQNLQNLQNPQIPDAARETKSSISARTKTQPSNLINSNDFSHEPV